MTNDTINDAVTMAGGAGALLARRYRVVRQLGSGGMGSVWLAEDTQLDNKPFAIKMLPVVLVRNKRAYNQLKAEALVAMKLVHPNIVQVRAFEENDGNPFLVMDYIDGQTLDDYLCEKCKVGGRISEDEVLRILKPIAAALDYAHCEGVVHRDVKPANVMIRKDGHPFILDFGIAREIQETMTRMTGKLFSGTLLYMSPEQLMGDQPNPAQDVYSFAAMAYECLKGEPPFSHGQIEFQIMNKQPDPLPMDVLTGKAAILAAGVMAGLAKQPKDRPPTCTAVLEWRHVERVEGGNGRARSPSGPQPVGRRVPTPPQSGGPRPVAAVKGLLAAALLAALAGGAWWLLGGRNGTTVTNGTTRTAKAQVPEVPSPATNAVAKPAQPALEETQRAVNDARRNVAFIRRRVESSMEKTIKPYRAYGKDFGEILSEIDRRHEALKSLKDPVTIAEARKFTADAEDAADEIERKGVEKLKNRLKFCVSEEVKSAKEFFEKSEKGEGTFWNEVIAAADRALALEPSNDEAKKLKSDAESRLVPAMQVVAKIGGSEVPGAKVKADGKIFTTPFERKNLKKGSRYGPYDVSYENGGRRYYGKLDVTVDWRGPRVIPIALKEHIGPKAGEVKTLTLPDGVEMKMIYVAPGSFTMGSPGLEEGRFDNETQHRVTLTKGYWLGKYEVTQRQWESVMGENPSRFNGADRPVENVSWDDCQRFIETVDAAVRRQFGGGARLPTEAEWEYACRAGTTTAYSWGGALNGDMANCDGRYPCGTTVKGRHRQETSDVGSYSPNTWGFHDMHGNVWEWCQDWYGSYNGNENDPKGPASGDVRVLRGGGWLSYARFCRSALRSWRSPATRYNFCGFRLCCSSEPRD